jgi:hypothetical protein
MLLRGQAFFFTHDQIYQKLENLSIIWENGFCRNSIFAKKGTVLVEIPE